MLKRIRQFQNPINAMCIIDKKIILASGNIIDVLNLKFEYCYKINEHKGLITSLICLKNKFSNMASSSKDGAIKVYLISDKDYNLIQHIQINNSIIYRINQLFNNNIISCSKNQTIIYFSNIGNTFQFQLKIYDPSLIPINDICKNYKFNIKMINNKGQILKSNIMWLY